MNNKTSGKYHASVTSLFSKTKGFFCFSLNKISPKDTFGKLSFFAYVISQKRSANQQKQPRNDAPHVKTSQSAKN